MADINVEALVKSYEELEKLALAKMEDSERVIWFQRRAISAEEANRQLAAENTRSKVATESGVKPELLKGFKTEDEMRQAATIIKQAVDEAKAEGQTTVEAAVKEALKQSDEQIAEMRKAYGRARTPQAGDVVGSQAQAVADSKTAGLIPDQGEDLSKFTGVDRVNKEIEKAVGPMLDRLGLRER